MQRRCDSAPRNIPDLEAVPERALLGRCALVGSFVQDRQQPPLRQIEVTRTGLRVTANNRRILGRCDVPGRRQVRSGFLLTSWRW